MKARLWMAVITIAALISAPLSFAADERLGIFEAIAYIDEQQDFDVVKFAETVAVNRGIPIAVFSTVEDAQNWLRHRRPDAPEQNIFTDEAAED